MSRFLIALFAFSAIVLVAKAHRPNHNADYWKNKYNMYRNPAGLFQEKDFFVSEINTTKPGDHYPAGAERSVMIMSHLLFEGSGFTFLQSRPSKSFMFWLAGHTLLVKTFNESTGVFDSIAIGNNIGDFTVEIGAGVWHTVMLKDYGPGKYAFMAGTSSPGFLVSDININTARLLEGYPNAAADIKKYGVPMVGAPMGPSAVGQP